MATLIVRIEDGVEPKNIAAAVRQLKGVAKVKVQKDKAVTKSAWQQAIAEGAVTVDEFFGEVRRQINEHYDNA